MILTEVPEFFAGLVKAFFAGHIRSGFLADVAVKSDWVGIAVHSACRLAAAKAATNAEALFGEWGREGLNLQPTDSKSVALRQLSYDPKRGHSKPASLECPVLTVLFSVAPGT